MPRSSTPSSATPPSSCRRASPRASGSPWRRPCGRRVRWWPARSEAFTTRSSTASTACSSPTLAICGPSAPRSTGCWGHRQRRPASAPAPGSGSRSTSSATAISSSGWICCGSWVDRDMKAWVVQQPGPIDEGPLAFVERPTPEPAAGELRVRVAVCGVCRTDLHLAEGDLPPHGPEVVPGHEIVGVVDRLGPGASRFALGERVGIAWLRRTCGTCRFCLRGDENLCLDPRFTGWDADGGYADYAVVDERYAYRLPDGFDDE